MLPQIEITKTSRRVTKFFIRGSSSNRNTANHTGIDRIRDLGIKVPILICAGTKWLAAGHYF